MVKLGKKNFGTYLEYQQPKWLKHRYSRSPGTVCFSWARMRTENLTPVYCRLRSNWDHLGFNHFGQQEAVEPWFQLEIRKLVPSNKQILTEALTGRKPANKKPQWRKKLDKNYAKQSQVYLKKYF